MSAMTSSAKRKDILAESKTDRKLIQGEVLAEMLLFLDGSVILVGQVTSAMQFEN